MTNRFEELGKKYGNIIGLAVLLIIWFLPTPDGMNITQQKLLAIFAGAIVLWITQSVNFAISTIIIVPLLYLWVGNAKGAVDTSGALIHDANFALSGYSSSALWMLVTGFIISISMIETGIAKRLALHILKKFGKTPFGAIIAPMIANFFIAPLTPSNTARTAAMLPIVEGVAEAYQAKKGESNFGKALFISNTMASNITAGGFMTGTIPNPIAIGMIAGVVGAHAHLSWGFWALAAVPTTIILLVLTVFVLNWLYPSEVKSIPGGLDYLNKEIEQLGPISLNEKKALFYFLLALVLWSTDMWHKLNTTMVAFVVCALILLPKIGVLTWKQAQKGIPWDLFVYFGGVITLSSALTSTKAFSWVIEGLIGSLGLDAIPMMPLCIALMGFTIFSHIIWSTTTAMAGVMIPIYINLAQAFGFPIVAFVLPQAILMGYAFFLPFNTMGNIIMFGAGYFSVSELLKSGLVLGVVAWVLWAATALVWFPIIGLN